MLSLFILLLLGLFIGSFLNVLIDRIPTGENPFVGRSHCDSCKKTLQATDLIPLFSYIFLKGKCRYCGHKLVLYYPLIEVTTGFMFALTSYMVFGLTNNGAILDLAQVLTLSFNLLLISIFIVIFFADMKFGIIPLSPVALGVIITILWHVLMPDKSTTFLNYLYSAAGSFLAFLSIFLITKGKGMGFGDVIYVFLMGLILGFPKLLVGFYIAFVTGAAFSLLLVALKQKRIRGGTIPFGPFLVIGTIVCLFWGDFLIGKIAPYLQ